MSSKLKVVAFDRSLSVYLSFFFLSIRLLVFLSICLFSTGRGQDVLEAEGGGLGPERDVNGGIQKLRLSL